MVLQCIEVTKQFGKLVAVDHLDFDVKEGEIFGITGPNVSGKTTLFYLIIGIYPLMLRVPNINAPN